jgi:hypothetical protein
MIGTPMPIKLFRDIPLVLHNVFNALNDNFGLKPHIMAKIVMLWKIPWLKDGYF